MTVVHKTGNIFTTDQPAIGHGVNNEGVMGAGIAKTVRAVYPSVYAPYRQHCHSPGLTGGDHLPLKAEEHDGESERWILNICSQEMKGRWAKYTFLETALEKAFDWVSDAGLTGVALPQIGAGIGGLEWIEVLAIIENRASHYPHLTVEVWTFDPTA